MTKPEAQSENSLQIPSKFNHYQTISTIGNGASSVVYLVKDTIKNQQYAAKVVSRQKLVEDYRLQYFDRELRLLQRIEHPHIVSIIDVVYQKDVIIVIMEYCENGDLLSYIISQGTVMPALQRQMAYELISAISFIHSKNYAHRDIKPENIFIDSLFHLKLGDFGLSKETSNNTLLTTLCGTIYYSAPEVLTHQKYDGHKADIWSFGIVLYTISLGRLPWSNTDTTLIMDEICNAKIQYPDQMPKLIENIIRDCTKLDPNDRPTADDILNSPWLKPQKDQILKNLPKAKLSAPCFQGNNTSIKTARFLMKPIRLFNDNRIRST